MENVCINKSKQPIFIHFFPQQMKVTRSSFKHPRLCVQVHTEMPLNSTN